MRAAANYINNRHYNEAINVLNNVEDHSALWYYYSAIAHAGLGNHAQALEYATIAADMEPNNYSYQNLVTQLRHGRGGYQDLSGPPEHLCADLRFRRLVPAALSSQYIPQPLLRRRRTLLRKDADLTAERKA